VTNPEFRLVTAERGTGVTYECGCSCEPTAFPTADSARSEHCCCGKVHFAGPGALSAMDAYLAERAATRRREPTYTRGHATVVLGEKQIEVAWAFPVEN